MAKPNHITIQVCHWDSMDKTCKYDEPVSLNDTSSVTNEMESLTSTNKDGVNKTKTQPKNQYSNGKLSAKGYTLDQVLDSIRELVHELEKLEDYHHGEAMKLQKKIGDAYWDYYNWRKEIGDLLSSEGYAVVSMKMLKVLNTIGIFKNDEIWFPTYYAYNTMWNFSDASAQLALSLAESDAVRLLTCNCGHKPYLNAIHSKNVHYIIKASLSILHNIARNPSIKHYFKEQKTSEVIQTFISSKDEMFKVLSMMTMAYIVEEEDNQTLIEETGSILCMLQWLDKALDCNKRRYKGFTPYEIVQGLEKLAVTDSNKLKIVDGGILSMLSRMLQFDDVREQCSAARILWTLMFDENVRERLINDEQALVTLLESLKDNKDKLVSANVKGVLWLLNGATQVTEVDKETVRARAKTHVFISYSVVDKESVWRIRDRLKEEGYQLWIDVDCMGPSNLQAMASGIENAAVVLICMSEKYKQSPSCRTEAEYTFRLRKDYIPMMMQKKYNPDGWLGTMLGAKLFFDFSGKYPFEKSFGGLIKELRGRGQYSPGDAQVDGAEDQTNKAGTSTENSGNEQQSPSKKISIDHLVNDIGALSPIVEMTNDEIASWLHYHKLAEYSEAFSQFDGKMLFQLSEMKKEAPEYFYQCMEKKMNMSLVDTLRFTAALASIKK
ncbi:uncharacterized protein LOC106868605 isoform X1 [Octopus bimaculoides]|nr:uncharacterized protein LOC106868605 isoform X1 [Octopus bimaculoides]|eukprot:XP_014769431.1 PREDICTED: uncharacterized protein LOC106868605 isoform X1 [Octopus bimaculoides]